MKTRQEILVWQSALFPNHETLPEICSSLRMGVNGSAEEWPSDVVRETLALLRSRLEYWEPSASPRCRAYDATVHLMVMATIQEVEAYDHWKGD